MTKTKRAVICGYYGRGNGGDEALLVSLLQVLPKSITPIVLSNNPAETRERYGVETCPTRDAWQVIQTLKKSDIFIWGGGSLMQDVSSAISPLYYGGVMLLARLLGLKTVAWAQGIGPLNRPFTRWFTKKVVRGCDAVSVRDHASARLVAGWGIDPLVAPDPVWALEGTSVKGLWDLPAPRVAVNLRPHRELTGDRISKLAIALADFQKATGAFILLVPFQIARDRPILEEIARQLPLHHKIVDLVDPRELKGLFRGVEMTIGMRFHSLIMAAAEDCRCFALSYDPKVARLMEEVGLQGWDVAELPEDPNEISRTWIDFYANGERLSGDRVRFLIDRALLHGEILARVAR
ncbi:polysaccharide pyruvyl transferase CsaB [Pannus brasiliensis CCIBt3594]|uniref:Polysaccharide pyruvyl transferase CsaB n=1 Tax=Pannus brasiliensis CCIBt3594 TaxID=1427578 RepID=A0AAW9QM93_9CHRO